MIGDKGRLGFLALFITLYLASLGGIYLYLQWLLGVPLLTTAGIVGIILTVFIIIGEIFYTFVTLLIIRELLS